jgi:hypothetical protein
MSIVRTWFAQLLNENVQIGSDQSGVERVSPSHLVNIQSTSFVALHRF